MSDFVEIAKSKSPFFAEHTDTTRDMYKPRRFRKTPKHVGMLKTTPRYDKADGIKTTKEDQKVDRIKYIQTHKRYRGKGLASQMVRDQQKDTGRKIVHSEDLTSTGRAFAMRTPQFKGKKKYSTEVVTEPNSTTMTSRRVSPNWVDKYNNRIT